MSGPKKRGRNHPRERGGGKRRKWVGDRLMGPSLEQKSAGDAACHPEAATGTRKATCFSEAQLRIYPSSQTAKRDF